MATGTAARPDSATKEFDQRQISWWAEGADGYQGRHMRVVIKPGKTDTEFVGEDEPLPEGTEVLFSVFTPTIPFVRPKAVTITTDAGTRDLLVEEPEADCLFWTPSSIEKFVIPYYVAHRLLTDQELDDLRDEVKSGKLAAILHVQPSKPSPIYAVSAAAARAAGTRVAPPEPFRVFTKTGKGEKKCMLFSEYARSISGKK
jgi:hypothetical protein